MTYNFGAKFTSKTVLREAMGKDEEEIRQAATAANHRLGEVGSIVCVNGSDPHRAKTLTEHGGHRKDSTLDIVCTYGAHTRSYQSIARRAITEKGYMLCR